MAKRSASTKRSGHTSVRGTSEPGRSTPAKGLEARRRSSGNRSKTLERGEAVTERTRRRADSEDDHVPTPPSSLDLDRHASAARSGRQQLNARRRKQNAVNPEISGGDVDADWMSGYFVGDEAPSGDNPTPGQVNVEEVGRAVGVDYQDTEELKAVDKIAKRDRKRWEMDPASSQDYPERAKEEKKRRR